MKLTIVRVVLALALYLLGAVVIGLALFPGVMLCRGVWDAASGMVVWQRVLATCLAAGAGYFLFGFSLVLLASLLRVLFRLDVKEGEYPIASAGMLRWYVSNALQLLVLITFGDFLLLTPFASLFFRMMGAKLGLNVQINSNYCADLALIEIGDNAVIGGHATVIAHSFEPKELILKKVRIGRNAVVGLNAIVMPGVEIGEEAVVGAGVFVPKDTRIPPGSTFLGK